MCYQNTASKFNTQCSIRTNSQVTNDGMLLAKDKFHDQLENRVHAT